MAMSRLVAARKLQRVTRGVYSLPQRAISAQRSLAEVALRVTRGGVPAVGAVPARDRRPGTARGMAGDPADHSGTATGKPRAAGGAQVRCRAGRLIKTPKVHLVDSGLWPPLSGLTAEDVVAQRERFGHLLESFVVQQLRAQAGWTAPELNFWHCRAKYQGRRGGAAGWRSAHPLPVSRGRDPQPVQHRRHSGGL